MNDRTYAETLSAITVKYNELTDAKKNIENLLNMAVANPRDKEKAKLYYNAIAKSYAALDEINALWSIANEYAKDLNEV